MSIYFKTYRKFFDDQSILQMTYTEFTHIENKVKFKETSVLIFVVDKSGSMGGSPFTLLKESINKLLPLVTDSFKKIQFITFDSQAREVSYDEFLKMNARCMHKILHY